MRWPLRYQILVPFSLLIVAAVLGLTTLNTYFAAGRVERETERQLRGVAKTLLDSNFPLNDVVLRQMRGLTGADFEIVDPAGTIMATSKAQRRLDNADRPLPEIGETDWRDLHLRGPANVDGASVFYMALGMQARPGNQQLSTLYILYPVDSYREARWAAAYPALLFGAAILVAAIVLGFWIARRLSRPLSVVSAHVGQLAEGNFQSLELPRRDDELRDLLLSINSLAGQLGVMRETIRQRERLAVLGQLSAGMVHNLRNDVTGAKMAMQLHQRGCQSGDQESLQVALRQLSLTEEHLKRFLAAGPAPAIEKRVTDLGALVQDAASLMGPTCRHRSVHLHVEAEADLYRLSLDAGQLRHAIIALVLNAIDAIEANGRIEVLVEDRDIRQIAVRIRDSGTGPKPADAQRIFDPFFTTKPEGVGLGLTAARQIALAHGGTLEYARAEGWTSFTILLPCEAVESPT